MKRMNQFDTSKITSTDEKELRDALSSAVKKVDATYEFKRYNASRRGVIDLILNRYYL